jgi:hypothetical protein
MLSPGIAKGLFFYFLKLVKSFLKVGIREANNLFENYFMKESPLFSFFSSLKAEEWII